MAAELSMVQNFISFMQNLVPWGLEHGKIVRERELEGQRARRLFRLCVPPQLLQHVSLQSTQDTYTTLCVLKELDRRSASHVLVHSHVRSVC